MSRFSIVVAEGRGVAERWRKQYQHPRDGWGNTASGNSKDVYEKLCALGPNPSPDSVAEVIGNKSWAHLDCIGCSEYALKAVRVGSGSYGEDALLCPDCIEQAAAAIKRAEAPND
jgi:hypothetical protein